MKGITDEKLKFICPFLSDDDLKKIDEHTRIEIEKGLNAFSVSKILGLIILIFGTIYLFVTFIHNSDGVVMLLLIIWAVIALVLAKNQQQKLRKALKIIDDILSDKDSNTN